MPFKDPERRREYQRKYMREYRARHPHRTRERKYGLEEGQIERWLDEQSGTCAICDSPPQYRSLHVDHDHDTGEARGLLCAGCNRGLGYLEDDEWLAKAEAYIDCT